MNEDFESLVKYFKFRDVILFKRIRINGTIQHLIIDIINFITNIIKIYSMNIKKTSFKLGNTI